MIEFLFNPTLNVKENNSLSAKGKELLLSLIFLLVFTMCSGFVITITDLFIKDVYSISIQDKVSSSLNDFSHESNIFLILILFPILEEFVFRYPLKINKTHLLISISAFFALFVIALEANIKILLISTLLLTILWLTKKKWEQSVQRFLVKNFSLFYYLSALFFALLHIFNYTNEVPKNLIFFLPIYVLPQFFFGLVAGYIRLKNGVLYSIILHFIFNLPFMIKTFVR